MQHKVVTALIAASAGLTAAPAHADRQSVCEDLDGLWSDRSEFVQITGRAACELTPESAGGSLLQLQYEYPSDVADDSSSGKQLAAYLSSRIKFYQAQLAGENNGELAVGVTYEEQSFGTTRTVVFTESAFTKGVRQPVTQKLTQTFNLASSAVPVPVPVPQESAAPAAPADGPTPTASPGAAAPTAPGTTIPSPAPSASAQAPGAAPAKPLAPGSAAPPKAPAAPAKPSASALPSR